MLKDQATIYRKLNISIDAIIVGVSFVLAMILGVLEQTGTLIPSEHYQHYYWLFFVVIFIWPLLLNLNGLYAINKLHTPQRVVFIIFKSAIQGSLILFSLLFLLKMSVVSRFIIGAFIITSTFLLLLKEIGTVFYLSFLREDGGGNTRHVIIVGAEENVKKMIAMLDSQPSLGIIIVGVLVPSINMIGQKICDKKVLGSIDEIEDFLHTLPIDNLIIAAEKHDDSFVSKIIFICEEEGVDVWLNLPFFFQSEIGKFEVDELSDMPIFVFRSGPRFSIPLLIKSFLDRVMGLLGTVLTFPIILMAGFFIKATSRGPVIFKQKRCGLHGKIFTMYKLRTMCENGDDIKLTLKDQNIMNGPIFKMHSDPRVTFVGKYFRKLSIDEIPQFWNMLKGEMSLVGPRPSIPDEVNEYQNWHRRRLRMKPGITGLLQVSGRNNVIDFNKWVEYDLKYIDNWSLWFDLKIILKTIVVVISTKGAK